MQEHPEVGAAYDSVCEALENYATAHAVQPHEAVGTMVFAAIDYMERMQNGEAPSSPPLLHPGSSISDYEPWLKRTDMVPPAGAPQLYAKLIGYNPEAITAIAWIREGTPFEIHDRELERFLVVEGSCDFSIGEKQFSLKAGDFLEIPLFEGHVSKVTSAIPCKVILQRVAA